MSDGFEKTWNEICNSLQEGQVIRNWGLARGYSGKNFKIHRIANSFIVIDSPTAKNLQTVPRSDFRKVWEIWGAYLTGKVPRHEIRDEYTRFSSYIISVFKEIYGDKP